MWLLPGIAVWLFADAGTTHLGASGLVYGLASWLFVAGMLRRDRRALAAAMLVAFLYGALVFGLVPIRPRMSWETHLAAAIVGGALAFALRHLDPAPPVRYSWEGEPGAEPHDDTHVADAEHADDDREPPPRLH
jgi:membrane associated rhomboid family serine protease